MILENASETDLTGVLMILGTCGNPGEFFFQGSPLELYVSVASSAEQSLSV